VLDRVRGPLRKPAVDLGRTVELLLEKTKWFLSFSARDLGARGQRLLDRVRSLLRNPAVRVRGLLRMLAVELGPAGELLLEKTKGFLHLSVRDLGGRGQQLLDRVRGLLRKADVDLGRTDELLLRQVQRFWRLSVHDLGETGQRVLDRVRC